MRYFGVILGIGAALALWSNSAVAQVPATLAAAPGETTLAAFHAEGAQVYECKPGSDGKLTWTFREPVATLLANGKTVGRHYAGPTWELADGSAVTGKAVANVPGTTANDIPWLKLEVASHRGNGVFMDVATVQRLNTQGGVFQGACDRAGGFHSAAYSADYTFLGKPDQDLTSSIPKQPH
jgi:hypothetical protein